MLDATLPELPVWAIYADIVLSLSLLMAAGILFLRGSIISGQVHKESLEATRKQGDLLVAACQQRMATLCEAHQAVQKAQTDALEKLNATLVTMQHESSEGRSNMAAVATRLELTLTRLEERIPRAANGTKATPRRRK